MVLFTSAFHLLTCKLFKCPPRCELMMTFANWLSVSKTSTGLLIYIKMTFSGKSIVFKLLTRVRRSSSHVIDLICSNRSSRLLGFRCACSVVRGSGGCYHKRRNLIGVHSYLWMMTTVGSVARLLKWVEVFARPYWALHLSKSLGWLVMVGAYNVH